MTDLSKHTLSTFTQCAIQFRTIVDQGTLKNYLETWHIIAAHVEEKFVKLENTGELHWLITFTKEGMNCIVQYCTPQGISLASHALLLQEDGSRCAKFLIPRKRSRGIRVNIKEAKESYTDGSYNAFRDDTNITKEEIANYLIADLINAS